MADRKISDLTALTTPASGDYLPIVDISETAASSKNKRITIEELFRGVPLGTAAAPSIAIEGDENTGIYSPGADQVAISTGGTERVEWGTSEVVFNDGGANYDFRIEGDTNSSLFFVDASTDRVGVGTTSPSAALHVSGNGLIAGSSQSTLTVGSGSFAGPHVIDVIGGGANIDFGYRLNNTFCLYANTGQTGPNARHTLAGPTGGNLVFNIGTERARIDSSGRLLVGTSSDSGGALLQVNGNRIRIATAKTPASASDTGTTGEVCWDADYIYVCTATNTWKRAALSTW